MPVLEILGAAATAYKLTIQILLKILRVSSARKDFRASAETSVRRMKSMRFRIMLLSSDNIISFVHCSVLASCIDEEKEIRNEAEQLLFSLESMCKVKRFFKMESLTSQMKSIEAKISAHDNHIQGVLMMAYLEKRGRVKEMINHDLIKVEQIGMTRLEIVLLEKHGAVDKSLGDSLYKLSKQYRRAKVNLLYGRFSELAAKLGHHETVRHLETYLPLYMDRETVMSVSLNNENDSWIQERCQTILAREDWKEGKFEALFDLCVKPLSTWNESLRSRMLYMICKHNKDMQLRRASFEALHRSTMCTRSKLFLADCYEFGRGTKRSTKEAKKVYLSIDAHTISILDIYRLNHERPVSLKRPLIQYLVENAHRLKCRTLGSLAIALNRPPRLTCEQSRETIDALLNIMTRKGYTLHQRIIAQRYSAGRFNFGGDLREAFRFFHMAARKDCIESIRIVITMYAHGLGISRDPIKSGQWREKLYELQEKSKQLQKNLSKRLSIMSEEINCFKQELSLDADVQKQVSLLQAQKKKTRLKTPRRYWISSYYAQRRF